MSAKAKRREHSSSLNAVQDRVTVAWQRLTVDTPTNWALTAISGDDGAGSFRVERVSEDSVKFAAYGIDIRWSNKVKSSQNPEQLDKRIKPLIDGARQTAKKGGVDCIPDIESANSDHHPERGEIREYSWKSSPAGVGRIWRCSECGRLIIVQVHGNADARFVSDARSILDTITCHNTEKGWTRWALYGIDINIPESYGLVKQQLMTIYLELRFGKLSNSVAVAAGETITVEQWSAASVQLKGSYLDEWIERKSADLLASLSIDKSETEMNGHPGLMLIGKRKGLGYWLGDGAKTIKALKKPALNYSAIAWECPDSNKVYLIQNMTSSKGSDLANQIAENVHCHDALDESG